MEERKKRGTTVGEKEIDGQIRGRSENREKRGRTEAGEEKGVRENGRWNRRRTMVKEKDL